MSFSPAPLTSAPARELRPLHARAHYYGKGTRLMQVAPLTPLAFQGEEFTAAQPLAALIAHGSRHHLALRDDLVTSDVRTRASYGQHVPLWHRWHGGRTRGSRTSFGRDLANPPRAAHPFPLTTIWPLAYSAV